MNGKRGMAPLDKWQRFFSVLMLVAILITALAPTPRAGARHKLEQMFYLAEEDYNTPFIGSYFWIHSLPFESKSFAGFAGYEQHSAHFALNPVHGIARITKFAGELVEIADLKFLAREEPGATTPSPKIYLSEDFWREAAGGSLDILGREILLDGQTVRVAGIIHENSGYFAGTEIWLPMRVSDPSARTESLRIVGRLREGVTWKDAQKELSRLARAQSNDLRYLLHCKLIPANEPIVFMTHDSQIEIVSRRAPVRQKGS